MMNLTDNKYLYPNMKAHAQGRNVLILSHLDSPFRRADGRRVSYCLEYRWLSKDPTETGEEVAFVKGQEYTYWSRRELQETGALKKHTSLFDCFNLF